MLSLPMIHIVAAHDFDPEYEAQFYALTPTSPLLTPEAIGIKAGQSLYAIGYDPENSLYFATNCKQLPFCSIAMTGYIPAQVFFPVRGVNNSTVRQQQQQEQSQSQNGNLSDEATPRHTAGLSTPGSDMDADGAGEVHHVVRGHGWENKAANAQVHGVQPMRRDQEADEKQWMEDLVAFVPQTVGQQRHDHVRSTCAAGRSYLAIPTIHRDAHIILQFMAQKDQRKPELVRIVAVQSFIPKTRSAGSVSVVNGQEYFLLGVNLEYNIFFVTNDDKLPFSKRAVAGYAPAEVFAFVEPVGSDVDRKKIFVLK
ncbi:hypothetical protein BJ742DRAFT_874507 [Cladochytrium replicatum]|nr:hypothetical protein BJ742DRAFT_874507 [Cladochytrium replicatum]